MASTATKAAPNSKPAKQTEYAPPVETPKSETPLVDAALLDPVLIAYCDTASRITEDYEKFVADLSNNKMRRMMAKLAAVEKLQAALTPEIMARIMGMVNKRIGFLTDRGPHAWQPDKKVPYSEECVKRCVVQALMEGFFPVNNEFNILAGRTPDDGQFYGALNGWERKVNEIEDIRNVKVSPGIPGRLGIYTIVRVAAQWELDGKLHELTDEFGKPGMVYTIQTNKGSTGDNIVGKARARALRDIFRAAMGRGANEEDHDDMAEAAQKTADLAAKLGNPPPAVAAAAAAASNAVQNPERADAGKAREIIQTNLNAVWKRAVDIGALDKTGLDRLVQSEFGGKASKDMSDAELGRLGERVQSLIKEFEEAGPASDGELFKGDGPYGEGQ